MGAERLQGHRQLSPASQAGSPCSVSGSRRTRHAAPCSAWASLHLSARALPTCREPLCRGTCWVLRREHFFERCLQFSNYVSLHCLPGCCPTQRKLLRYCPRVRVHGSVDTSEQEKGSRRGSQRRAESRSSSVRSDKTPPPQQELQQSCSETTGRSRKLSGRIRTSGAAAGRAGKSNGFRSPPPHVPVAGGLPRDPAERARAQGSPGLILTTKGGLCKDSRPSRARSSFPFLPQHWHPSPPTTKSTAPLPASDPSLLGPPGKLVE